jgi:hypothetical protein
MFFILSFLSFSPINQRTGGWNKSSWGLGERADISGRRGTVGERELLGRG